MHNMHERNSMGRPRSLTVVRCQPPSSGAGRAVALALLRDRCRRTGGTAAAWPEYARRVEGLGFSTLLVF